MTATVSPSATPADSTAWTAQAVGSTITASSSRERRRAPRGAGRRGPPARRATSRRRCRRRTRSAARARGRRRPRCRTARCGPSAHCGQSGWMCRGAQPSTGSMTARVPGASGAPAWSIAAVVEHPDHLVAGDEGEADHVLEVAGAAPVEGGQVRAADARRAGGGGGTSRRPGSSGGVGVEELQGPDAGAPARAEQRGHPGGGEAGQVALEDEGLHRPHVRRSSRRAAPASAACAGAPAPTRAPAVDRPEGERRAASRRRPCPVLDVPAPPAGDGGQLGLGVDRHREAHRLEHGQVAGRVGVGHRLLEVEALGLGVVGRGPGPGPRRWAGARRAGR